ncbi:MAG TPA: DUF4832 domain-containing protein [Planctomycetaceae bacterium]|nr:DUF4832 domain-containing protein [Planctomycetaceae bacterium]
MKNVRFAPHLTLSFGMVWAMVWWGTVLTGRTAVGSPKLRSDRSQPRARKAPLAMRLVRPRTSDAVLFNPGMGLYLAAGDRLRVSPPEDAWVFRIADIAYYRPVWSDLEPDGPRDSFEEYFQPIFDFWVKRLGKRVAFRIMSESMHARTEYATPKWVFDRGVPGVEHKGLWVARQVDPVFWDEKYLQVYCRFVERLGRYLDGRPGLEFIDVGGIGEWGEMHLGLHLPGRWTPDQLEATGFTREKYIAAYRRIIDVHARVFPRTRVFLNVGDYGQINDYAALRGLHFRQDGLTPRGPSADVGRRFYRSYARRGVLCNYEFHSSYRSMQKKGWDLKTTLEVGLSDPVSYLNTNVFGLSQWEKAPEEVKRLFQDAARRIGFRFVLKELEVQERIRVDRRRSTRLLLQHRWTNQGVAPCYESYALEFTLHDASGRIVVQQLDFPDTATTLWWPGETVTERTVLRLPAGLAPGQYLLKVAMIKPEPPRQRIRLALADPDADLRYPLCHIPAGEAPRPASLIRADFETDQHGWQATRGISAKRDLEHAHGGGSSLRIEGTQSGAWNYVVHTLNQPVYPGSKYRLTGWLKVDRLQPGRPAPYLKLGVTSPDGTWLANFSTTKYDLAQLGQWQRLVGVFETPPNAVGGHLALEKGDKGASITIRCWLDDVRLELLEGP